MNLRSKLRPGIVRTARFVVKVTGRGLDLIPGGAQALGYVLRKSRPRLYTSLLSDLLVERGHTELGLRVVEEHLAYLLKRPELIDRYRNTAAKRLARPLCPQTIPAERKAEVLSEVLSLFSARGWKPFLCFGVLLGKIREGDFMDHDMDLDIGFFYPETSCNEVRQALLAAGFKITLWEPDPWPCRLKAHKPGNPISLDIVFFKAAGAHRLTYSRYMMQTLIRKRKSFGLQPSTLRGIPTWIPDRSEDHLTENYGNWRVRSHYHHYILTSRLTDFSIPEVRYLLGVTLMNAIFQGRDSDIKALSSIAAQNFQDLLWKRLENRFTNQP